MAENSRKERIIKSNCQQNNENEAAGEAPSILDLNVIDSRGEMTSGMKTGKLKRHFSEAFGLIDLHQQKVQD